MPNPFHFERHERIAHTPAGPLVVRIRRWILSLKPHRQRAVTFEYVNSFVPPDWSIYWAPDVKLRVNAEIRRAAATGQLDKLRYWWDREHRRGYLTPCPDDIELAKFVTAARKESTSQPQRNLP